MAIQGSQQDASRQALNSLQPKPSRVVYLRDFNNKAHPYSLMSEAAVLFISGREMSEARAYAERLVSEEKVREAMAGEDRYTQAWLRELFATQRVVESMLEGAYQHRAEEGHNFFPAIHMHATAQAGDKLTLVGKISESSPEGVFKLEGQVKNSKGVLVATVADSIGSRY